MRLAVGHFSRSVSEVLATRDINERAWTPSAESDWFMLGWD